MFGRSRSDYYFALIFSYSKHSHGAICRRCDFPLQVSAFPYLSGRKNVVMANKTKNVKEKFQKHLTAKGIQIPQTVFEYLFNILIFEYSVAAL